MSDDGQQPQQPGKPPAPANDATGCVRSSVGFMMLDTLEVAMFVRQVKQVIDCIDEGTLTSPSDIANCLRQAYYDLDASTLQRGMPPGDLPSKDGQAPHA